jgi:hypothetical protein
MAIIHYGFVLHQNKNSNHTTGFQRDHIQYR